MKGASIYIRKNAYFECSFWYSFISQIKVGSSFGGQLPSLVTCLPSFPLTFHSQSLYTEYLCEGTFSYSYMMPLLMQSF